jgi:4-aminobutyrate aminotransferase-like enzyme
MLTSCCWLLLQVQSGAGRSGMWWAHGQFDGGAMQPDMVVFAKGIASGYPMAGACCCLR